LATEVVSFQLGAFHLVVNSSLLLLLIDSCWVVVSQSNK